MRNFELIPVIDLKGGVVVRAERGRRDRYAPIETPLAASSDAVEVAGALLDVTGAAVLYAADLDAIMGTGSNAPSLERLRRAFPDIELWADTGLGTEDDCAHWLARHAGPLVLGSESLASGDVLRTLGEAQADRLILSLDFGPDGFIGPEGVAQRPELWPSRVIVMSLTHVGSGAGPDMARLTKIMAQASGRQVFAAGGLRHLDDVLRLAEAGVAGALVASTLHERRLGTKEIAALKRGRRSHMGSSGQAGLRQ